MRTLPILCLAGLLSGPAAAAADGVPARLPGDTASLIRLEQTHLMLLRREQSRCQPLSDVGVPTSYGAARGCVVLGLERAVDARGDGQLAAYHAALPLNLRYDATRGFPRVLSALGPDAGRAAP